MSGSSINTHTHLEPHISEQSAKLDEAFVTHPWIRHYEPGVPAHLEIPDQPLTWLLDCTASLPKSLIGKVLRRVLRAGV